MDRSTPIVRLVNGLSDIFRVVRGELFMFYVHGEEGVKKSAQRGRHASGAKRVLSD